MTTQNTPNLKARYEKFKADRKENLKKIAVGIGIGTVVTYAIVTRNIRQEQETLRTDLDTAHKNLCGLAKVLHNNDVINVMNIDQI